MRKEERRRRRRRRREKEKRKEKGEKRKEKGEKRKEKREKKKREKRKALCSFIFSGLEEVSSILKGKKKFRKYGKYKFHCIAIEFVTETECKTWLAFQQQKFLEECFN